MDEQPAIVARGPPINSAELQFGRRYIVVALLVCCGTGLISVALGPDNNWDLGWHRMIERDGERLTPHHLIAQAASA